MCIKEKLHPIFIYIIGFLSLFFVAVTQNIYAKSAVVADNSPETMSQQKQNITKDTRPKKRTTTIQRKNNQRITKVAKVEPSSDSVDLHSSQKNFLLNEISFSGNKTIPSNELFQVIQMKKEGEVNEDKMLEDMQRIANLYMKKHIKITVAPSIASVSRNYVKIIYKIEEQPLANNSHSDSDQIQK